MTGCAFPGCELTRIAGAWRLTVANESLVLSDPVARGIALHILGLEEAPSDVPVPEVGPTPSVDLYYTVLGAFVSRRTTLNGWCRTNGVLHQNAKFALTGGWNGPTAQKLRRRILAAAGLTSRDLGENPA